MTLVLKVYDKRGTTPRTPFRPLSCVGPDGPFTRRHRPPSPGSPMCLDRVEKGLRGGTERLAVGSPGDVRSGRVLPRVPGPSLVRLTIHLSRTLPGFSPVRARGVGRPWTEEGPLK